MIEITYPNQADFESNHDYEKARSEFFNQIASSQDEEIELIMEYYDSSQLVNDMNNALNSNLRLKKLTLGVVFNPNISDQIAEFIRANKSITNISIEILDFTEISGKQPSVEGKIYDAVLKNQHLTEFDLSFGIHRASYGISPDVAEHLNKNKRKAQLSQTHQEQAPQNAILTADLTEITCDSVVEFATYLTSFIASLQDDEVDNSVGQSNYHIHKNSEAAIFRATNCSLEHRSLVEILENIDRFPKLKTLDLSENNLGSNPNSLVFPEFLPDQNQSLVLINLAGNKIGNRWIGKFLGWLQNNQTINELNLGHNQIGLSGSNAIAQFLGKNQTLQVLNLSNQQYLEHGQQVSHFQDDALETIFLALEKNKTLTTIDLSKNPLANKGVEFILKALKTNHSLIAINLEGTEISTEKQRQIQQLVARNIELKAEFEQKFLAAAQEENPLNLIILINKDVAQSFKIDALVKFIGVCSDPKKMQQVLEVCDENFIDFNGQILDLVQEKFRNQRLDNLVINNLKINLKGRVNRIEQKAQKTAFIAEQTKLIKEQLESRGVVLTTEQQKQEDLILANPKLNQYRQSLESYLSGTFLCAEIYAEGSVAFNPGTASTILSAAANFLGDLPFSNFGFYLAGVVANKVEERQMNMNNKKLRDLAPGGLGAGQELAKAIAREVTYRSQSSILGTVNKGI